MRSRQAYSRLKMGKRTDDVQTSPYHPPDDLLSVGHLANPATRTRVFIKLLSLMPPNFGSRDEEDRGQGG